MVYWVIRCCDEAMRSTALLGPSRARAIWPFCTSHRPASAFQTRSSRSHGLTTTPRADSNAVPARSRRAAQRASEYRLTRSFWVGVVGNLMTGAQSPFSIRKFSWL
ncbi:hypothetical protein G6F24_018651 [Rhizopus arrhizus]|nr:hypothetical protein G6F24_018651 [Rhizopus arrhizus]